MRFSQRMGYRPVRTVLQVESMDQDLKNILWNIITEDYFLSLSRMSYDGSKENEIQKKCRIIWKEFFKLTIDVMPGTIYEVNATGVINYIRDWFFDSAKWYDIYDFIEFIEGSSLFIDKVNIALEKEVSGYRIINGQLTQITSEGEIAEIEEAITSSDKWKSVNTHLNAALNFLSDRKNPDYRNSIKESISAVEAICIILTGDPKATLGKMLTELERNHSLDGGLKGAFNALYGYTSNAGGIRHALIDEANTPTFEEAKFMLVSCSAFINYLKAKMQV